MKVKLNSLIRYPISVNFRVKSNSGSFVTRILRLVPDKGYEILEELVDPISDITKKIDYSEEAEETLKKGNVTYEIVRGCGSCGGKRKKIEFPVLEVIG